MKNKSRIALLLLTLGALCMVPYFTGCAQKQTTQQKEEPVQAEKIAETAQPSQVVPSGAESVPEKVQAAEGEAPVQIASGEAAKRGVYNFDVKELTITECGRCHNSHFRRLKDHGSRHQTVTCTDCHELFHAYNPLKNNYAEIMPVCAKCHDNPHGSDPAVAKCLSCHMDPHQPIVGIPDASKLETQCRLCHAKVAKSLIDKPSKHTNEACSSCHSETHGRIPNCSECHESHSPSVALNNPDCMACHPVHTPLVITYPQDQDNTVCAGCHAKAYDQLQANVTKHTALSCAECHPSHGQLMACSDCHSSTPHNASIHQKFPVCGSCHDIAHNLHL